MSDRDPETLKGDPETPGRRGRPAWWLWAFVVTCMVIPAIFFVQTWYGTRLDDARLDRFLRVGEKPDRVRHAITEVTRRFDEGAAGMDRWAQKLVEVSRSTDESVRLSAAWAMQYDPGRPVFHARLVELLGDSSLLARQNAATSLAAGGSDEGLSVLRSMLGDHTVTAPRAGTVDSLLGSDQPVRAGGSVCRIVAADGSFTEALAPVPGRVLAAEVEVGAAVAAGDPLLALAPDQEQVLNAVIALSLVGDSSDVSRLRQVADPRSGHAETVRSQADRAANSLAGEQK